MVEQLLSEEEILVKKVVVDIKGGYGNQLFCYAFGYAQAKRNHAKLYLDSSMQDNGIVKDRKMEIFNLKIEYDKRISYHYSKKKICRYLCINRLCKKNAIGWLTRVYNEKQAFVYEPDIRNCNVSTYYDGFWQSYHYFDEYRDDIIRMYVDQQEKSTSVQKLVQEQQKCESVAVHVRRGDYVGLNWSLPMNYYEKAMEKMQEILGKDVEFYIYSDDNEYVREYFSNSKFNIKMPQYDSKNKVIDDMYLMSNCKNMIIANSSYSWWAAYLNKNEKKKIVCPEIGMWNSNFYLKEWHSIKIGEYEL